MLSMKNHVREALLTAALFGSVNAGIASAPESSRSVTPAQSPKLAGQSGADEPVATRAAAPGAAPAVVTNGSRDETRGAV
jgi:hypothetical protein